jgi:hypothetical protein
MAALHNKKGFDYYFVGKHGIKFLPKYKEFKCKLFGEEQNVFLIGVMFDEYDSLKDKCFISKITDENKANDTEIDVGITVKGADLINYKNFIRDFIPPGL